MSLRWSRTCQIAEWASANFTTADFLIKIPDMECFGRGALSGVLLPRIAGLNTFSKTQSTPHPPISPPNRHLLFPSNILISPLCCPYGPFRLPNDLPLPPIQLQAPRGQAGGLPPPIGFFHQRKQPSEPFSAQL